jgi:hypothetical protein
MCDVSVTTLIFDGRRAINCFGPGSKVPFVTERFLQKVALINAHELRIPRVIFQPPRYNARRVRYKKTVSPSRVKCALLLNDLEHTFTVRGAWAGSATCDVSVTSLQYVARYVRETVLTDLVRTYGDCGAWLGCSTSDVSVTKFSAARDRGENLFRPGE